MSDLYDLPPDPCECCGEDYCACASLDLELTSCACDRPCTVRPHHDAECPVWEEEPGDWER